MRPSFATAFGYGGSSSTALLYPAIASAKRPFPPLDLPYRDPEGHVELGALRLELDRPAELLDAFLVLFEEEHRAPALVVAGGVVLIHPEDLIGNLECLGALGSGDQRLGVQLVAVHVGGVRV